MNFVDALSQAAALSLAGPVSRTTDLEGTAVDLHDYEGVALFVLNAAAATAGSSPKLDCKIQHSATTTAGDFADVSGATYAQVTDQAGTAGVQVLKLDISSLKRYVRIIGDLTGSSAAFDFSAEVVAFKKSV